MKIDEKAFSLIELIVILLTVSCILAAFSPILTKHIKEYQLSNATDNKFKKYTINCAAKFGVYCLLCEGETKCINCELDCTYPKVLNSDKCTCE